MVIKLYKKLFLANSIYYGHNYINCMNNESDINSKYYWSFSHGDNEPDINSKYYWFGLQCDNESDNEIKSINNMSQCDNESDNEIKSINNISQCDNESDNEIKSINNMSQGYNEFCNEIKLNNNDNISDKFPDNMSIINFGNSVISNDEIREIENFCKNIYYYQGNDKNLIEKNNLNPLSIYRIMSSLCRVYKNFLIDYLNCYMEKITIFKSFEKTDINEIILYKEMRNLMSLPVKYIFKKKGNSNKGVYGDVDGKIMNNIELCNNILGKTANEYNNIKEILNMENKDFYKKKFLKYCLDDLFEKNYSYLVKDYKEKKDIYKYVATNFLEILNKKNIKNKKGNRNQENLIDLNQKEHKRRGRKKEIGKNNSFEDEVVHDKFEKHNILDKIIRKYIYFLRQYLNSILEKNEIKNFEFHKIETASGQMKFYVIKKFFDSSVIETIAKERKRYKYPVNENLCSYIMDEEDKKFNEIKDILNKTNSDIYKNIFLENHIVELENGEKTSYNSILDLIEKENGGFRINCV